MRVGHRHLPLGFRDVRPPLQKIGGQPGIERRWLHIQLFAGQMKVGGGFPEQDRNCIFKLFPLLQEQYRLRPRGIQQRFFLRNIQPRGYAAFVPLIDQLQAAFQCFHGAMQNSQLRIELPQREIVARELRRDHQPDVLEIGRACLVGCLRRFNAAAPPAKQIHFIADREWQRNVCLRDRAGRGKIAARGTIAREALALDTRRRRYVGELRGNLDSSGCSGLLQTRRCDSDCLICIERLFFKRA